MTDEQIIYTHGDPLDAAERWIKIVERARNHLKSAQFQEWLTLVGSAGDDNVRCFKGEQFLKMLNGSFPRKDAPRKD